MRLILYTGKGGVGKTTTAAATGALAAEQGLRTLVISADAAHSLGDVFDVPLGPEPRRLAERLDALEVDARHVIESHWGRVRDYLVELLRYQGIEEVIADELALVPGADELATLVSVEQWAESGNYDLILVDCAPTGSMLRLVTLPEVVHSGLRWMLRLQRATARIVEPLARGLVGAPLPKAEVFAEADRLFYKTLHRLRARLLSAQTSIRIVVTPESMVIDEARRSLTDLCLFQLASDAVIVNRILPEQACQEAFFQEWGRMQLERVRDVEAAFSPMACLTAPLERDEVRGVAALREHAKMLFGKRDPAAILGSSPRLRFERDRDGARIRLPLPGLDPTALDVTRVEDELVIGVEDRRRKIALPVGFSKLEIERVSYHDGELLVFFAAAGKPSTSHVPPAPPTATAAAQ
jgi:arsenite-transporting ATPase